MKKILYTLPVIALIVLLSGFFFVQDTIANPSRFSDTTCQTSTATTSPRYMGTAQFTSTTTCNLITIAKGSDSMDSAVLLVQFHASSSPVTQLRWYYEYSQDGVNWYKDQVSMVATSSSAQADGLKYLWTQVASSTSYSSNGISTSSVAASTFYLPTPTKWVRVIFSTSGTNGAVWSQIIGKTEALK